MKKSYGKKLLAAVISAAMAFTMMPAFGMQAFADAEDETKTVKIAILSDIHYVNYENRTGGATTDFDNAEKAENRMMKEIDMILDEALKEAIQKDTDAMLVCGDLCSNGEKANESGLAEKLYRAEDGLKEGANIYVVNGNHDINNSYGADFTGANVKTAARTRASEFKKIYEHLGYEKDGKTHYYNANPGEEVKNYGGLSYATEIQDGITLIALDTAQYSGDTGAEYGNAQITAGNVSDGLLAWAVKEASAAKKKGNLVLAMCHHSIIPHQGIKNNASDMFFSEYLVPNWEHVAGTLADAGVSAILTGHSHANDISQYTSQAGNTIYDIQTAALCAYPCAWRELNITIDKSSGEANYSFDIVTHFIDSVIGMDYKYDGKTYSGLQEYSYVKTGLPENALPNLAGFFIREQMYAVKSHDGELEGFLKEKLEIPDVKSVGEYATEELSNQIDGIGPVTEEFSLYGSKFTLKLNPDKKGSTADLKVFDISLDYLTGDVNEVTLDKESYQKIKVKLDELAEDKTFKDTFTVTHDEVNQKWVIAMTKGFPLTVKAELCRLAGVEVPQEVTEEGKLSINLSGMADGIEDAIAKANTKIKGKNGDWDNNYKRTEIETEAARLISEKAHEALTKPITEGVEQTKPLFIARDALQAFARGDEDSFVEEEIYKDTSASELKSKRKNWNELLRSKDFEDNIKQTLVDCAGKLTSNKNYPEIYDVLNTYMGPNSSSNAPIFTFKAKEGTDASSLNALCSFLLGGIKTPKDVLSVAVTLNSLGVHPLSAVSLEKLTTLFADLQASLTTDSNIKADSDWTFHTVSLDAAGGSVSAFKVTTVDDGRAGALPVPVRSGYDFQGWFTDAEGGEKVTEDTDLTDAVKLYAHWELSPGSVPADTTPVGSVHNAGGSEYVVTSEGTVSLVKAKSKKSFTIPAEAVIEGKTFSVTGISAKAFKGTKVRTLVVKTKNLTKKSVKGSLKGSKVRKVKVKVGKKKINRKYVKKYRKIFTKKNAGKKVRVTR